MTLPMALVILGAAFWPVTLALALAAAGLGAYVRGGWRVVCLIVAGALAADLVLGLPLVAQW